MVKENNIKSHFSNKAKNYHYKSLTFPWSLIRKNESRIILNFLGDIREKNILDVGSGSGYYSKLMVKKKAKKVYALDNSKAMLNNITEKNIVKINQSAESFDIKKKFEKIVCAGLLEFVGSSEKVLKNIKKHSKKKCELVILCPQNNILAKIYKFYHYLNKINIRLFEFEEIEKVLNLSGWKIKKIKKILFSNIILATLKDE